MTELTDRLQSQAVDAVQGAIKEAQFDGKRQADFEWFELMRELHPSIADYFGQQIAQRRRREIFEGILVSGPGES